MVLNRVMKGHPTRVMVQPARYSSFEPDRWWETRDGVRTEIVELQKLVLEVVLHQCHFDSWEPKGSRTRRSNASLTPPMQLARHP
jgi:hypothetical protein